MNPQVAPESLLAELRALTGDLDRNGEWPSRPFELLAESDVLKWVIPRRWGGSELGGVDLIRGYVELSSACMLTTFVLTQRNGACQRIAANASEPLQEELLVPLSRGELFATVGISHLTTSRQHMRTPAVRAVEEGDAWRLDGEVPWVTGAAFADWILTGGTCDDGRQVLVAVPTSAEGVTVRPAVRLMAMNASHTGAVQLNGVRIAKRYIVAGPVERVMVQGAGGTGSLTTSALAVGATSASLRQLTEEAEGRPELGEIVQPLAAEWDRLSDDLYRASAGETGADLTAEAIRRRANSLVLRAAQAYLAASKGAGYVEGHPAGRAVREALFFLVWSCPAPVLNAALREFACLG